MALVQMCRILLELASYSNKVAEGNIQSPERYTKNSLTMMVI